jgi:hypothetical protein
LPPWGIFTWLKVKKEPPNKITQKLQGPEIWENIKQARGNECSRYKSTAAIVSSSLPICPVYFHLVVPRHVLRPCSARYEHIRGLKGYVTCYLACYVRLQVQNMRYYMRLRVQNMPRCHLRKYGWGQTGRLEEKIAAALLYRLHSFPLACLMFSRNLTPSDSQSRVKTFIPFTSCHT